MKRIDIGSVSSGTTRLKDIGPAVLDVALDVLPSDDELLRDAHEADEREWSGEYDGEVLDELIDAINEFCPPYVYFGAHPGDPADFGFWPDFDLIEQDVRDGVILKTDGDVPEDWRGYVLQVNDHGNTTMHLVTEKGVEVLWDCV
jgi:hypothetical protein